MQERRQHQRIAPKGAVTLRSGEFTANGRLANISKSGVLVAMRVDDANELLANQASIEIRLDTGIAEWLTATGRITRIDDEGVAVTFDAPQSKLLAMIDKAVGASDASTRLLTVVLIDRDSSRRAKMSADLRLRGCTVFEVGSPLEAIVRLGELSFEPNVIAIADSFPAEDARAMRDFVGRRHPGAQLVTIIDDALPV
jgi:hypothetical protein